jgi:Ca2+-binding EF-hand superfamily protein
LSLRCSKALAPPESASDRARFLLFSWQAKEGRRTTMMGKFAEIVKKSIDEQARYFLERYMEEFTGRWEEVLDQAQEFRKYDINNRDGELQEQEFLVYMEKRGEPMTPIQLRETLKDIDLDKVSGSVSFYFVCVHCAMHDTNSAHIILVFFFFF